MTLNAKQTYVWYTCIHNHLVAGRHTGVGLLFIRRRGRPSLEQQSIVLGERDMRENGHHHVHYNCAQITIIQNNHRHDSVDYDLIGWIWTYFHLHFLGKPNTVLHHIIKWHCLPLYKYRVSMMCTLMGTTLCVPYWVHMYSTGYNTVCTLLGTLMCVPYWVQDCVYLLSQVYWLSDIIYPIGQLHL